MMNIEANNVNKIPTKDVKTATKTSSDASFMEELKNLENAEVKSTVETEESSEVTTANVADIADVKEDNPIVQPETVSGDLSNIISEMNSSVVQMDEIDINGLKHTQGLSVTKNNNADKDLVSNMLNNDMNIHKLKEQSPELKADISFAQNGGEAFSSFLSNSDFQETADDLNEDNTVLSSAAENLAMINKTLASTNVSQIKEVGVVIDRTIDVSTLNLTRNDINFFVNLVNENLNLQDVTESENVKSAKVSEVMANMLAESMRNNKAFRLNFDNSISVIIKVSKEGKISANFLPGTDVAENYLRNNLSTLVQRFEEEGIPYDELNHQKHKRDSEQQNKKDKDNE